MVTNTSESWDVQKAKRARKLDELRRSRKSFGMLPQRLIQSCCPLWYFRLKNPHNNLGILSVHVFQFTCLEVSRLTWRPSFASVTVIRSWNCTWISSAVQGGAREVSMTSDHTTPPWKYFRTLAWSRCATLRGFFTISLTASVRSRTPASSIWNPLAWKTSSAISIAVGMGIAPSSSWTLEICSLPRRQTKSEVVFSSFPDQDYNEPGNRLVIRERVVADSIHQNLLVSFQVEARHFSAEVSS